MSSHAKKISFVIPCLNEEKGLKIVIPEIAEVAKKYNLNYEIVLADNNSTDGSVAVARELAKNLGIEDKLVIVVEKTKGYGAAYQAGFNAASGEICVMADADGTYDFSNVPHFLKKIDEGYDMVIGNRFSGKIEKEAMPFVNRYIGNPVLSGLVRILFDIKVKDIHSGMRAMTKDAYIKLNLYTKGMEFASEMIVQAGKKNIKITEIDMNYRVRAGDSKLERMKDGWKHLRFILIYSPYYTFFIPGLFLFAVGAILNTILYFRNIHISSFVLQTHPMFFIMTLIIIGYQLMFFAIFNKVYSFYHLDDADEYVKKYLPLLSLEKLLSLSLTLLLTSIIIAAYVVLVWVHNSFGSLNQTKNLIWSVTFFTLSVQTFFSALMISIVGVRGK